MEENFSAYKPEVRALETFQDDYGLELDEDDSEDDEEPIETPDSDEED